MNPTIATLLFSIGVLGLFLLDRDPTVRTSKGLWIAVIWVLIVGSRPVTGWMAAGPVQAMNNADQYLEGSPIDRFVFSGLLVAGIFILVRRRVQLGKLLQNNSAILLFFAYCAVSVLWSD